MRTRRHGANRQLHVPGRYLDSRVVHCMLRMHARARRVASATVQFALHNMAAIPHDRWSFDLVVGSGAPSGQLPVGMVRPSADSEVDGKGHHALASDLACL